MEVPSTNTSSACISNGCFAFGVATIVPVTITAAPMFNFAISSKLLILSAEYTTCNVSKKVPSFTTKKPKVLESRFPLTQPPTVTFLSI